MDHNADNALMEYRLCFIEWQVQNKKIDGVLFLTADFIPLKTIKFALAIIDASLTNQ